MKQRIVKPSASQNGSNFVVQMKLNTHEAYVGEGNIDDVKKFNPTFDNAVVYADKPKVSSKKKTKLSLIH